MSNEDSNNFLYLGKKVSGEIGYVGIGGVARPYGGHNPGADEVLRSGEVWITSSPFSSRRDAEMAESLVIRALTWAAESKPDLSNIAKVSNSKYLVPALKYREGLLKYSEVKNSLLVKIRPGSLKGRTAPHGETGNIDLTMRCNRWWGLGNAVRQRKDVRFLIAVTAHVKPARVIGVWKTKPVDDWWWEDQSNPESSRTIGEKWNISVDPYSETLGKGWVVTVESPNPDVNEWQGLEFDWENYKPQRLGYSADLRDGS